MDWETASKFITPAIIASALAYLVRFFGKVIADQKPYADNRNWLIELAGIFFVSSTAFWGVIGAVLALRIGDLGTGHLLRCVIVLILIGWLWLAAHFSSEEIYKNRQDLTRLNVNDEIKAFAEDFRKWVLKIDHWIPQISFPIIFAYLLTLEYLSWSLGWFIAIFSQVFMGFLFLAWKYSLSTTRLPEVDIYFMGSDEPLRGVLLLKINDDNVRVRDGNKVIVLNKSQIKRMEFILGEKA
ncbi:MAG: hypothetical protein ABSE68_02330 [Minisyncoccia bacterium]